MSRITKQKRAEIFNAAIDRLESRTLMSATPAVTTPMPASYSSELAIARWDTVANQTFQTQLDAGVVAFQATGIARVDFTVNGGPAVSVTKMTLNPQTNVWEYVMPLQASNFADGAIQLGATAYPVVGQARALPTITLYSNAGNTLPTQTLWVSTTGNDANTGSQSSPFATIEAATEAANGGATIYLQAGTYSFTGRGIGWNENGRWITVEAAPGVARSQVVVNPSGNSMRVYNLQLENLTIHPTLGGDIEGWNWVDGKPNSIWLDNCDVSDANGMAASEIQQIIDPTSWTHEYVTNTSIHDYPGRGLVNVELARNDSIYNLGDDAIDEPGLVVNTTIDNVLAASVGDHIDGVQWWPPNETAGSDSNSIVYGVRETRVDGQLLFGSGVSNVAVVNFFGTSLQGGAVDPAASQWGGGTLNNLYFDHLTMPNQAFFFADDNPAATFADNALVNSVMWRVYAKNSTAETLANDRIMDVSSFSPSFGQYTVGDPSFNNASAGDFSPAASSPLIMAGMTPDVPSDVLGNARSAPDAIGAFAPLSVSPVTTPPPVVAPPVVTPPVVTPPVVTPPVVTPPVVTPPVVTPPVVAPPVVKPPVVTPPVVAPPAVIPPVVTAPVAAPTPVGTPAPVLTPAPVSTPAPIVVTSPAPAPKPGPVSATVPAVTAVPVIYGPAFIPVAAPTKGKHHVGHRPRVGQSPAGVAQAAAGRVGQKSSSNVSKTHAPIVWTLGDSMPGGMYAMVWNLELGLVA